MTAFNEGSAGEAFVRDLLYGDQQDHPHLPGSWRASRKVKGFSHPLGLEDRGDVHHLDRDDDGIACKKLLQP